MYKYPCECTSTNMCALNASKSRMGNWSMEVGASAISGSRGSGVLMRARLDHRETIWMNGMLEGRCLRSSAGYTSGKSR